MNSISTLSPGKFDQPSLEKILMNEILEYVLRLNKKIIMFQLEHRDTRKYCSTRAQTLI